MVQAKANLLAGAAGGRAERVSLALRVLLLAARRHRWSQPVAVPISAAGRRTRDALAKCTADENSKRREDWRLGDSPEGDDHIAIHQWSTAQRCCVIEIPTTHQISFTCKLQNLQFAPQTYIDRNNIQNIHGMRIMQIVKKQQKPIYYVNKSFVPGS